MHTTDGAHLARASSARLPLCIAFLLPVVAIITLEIGAAVLLNGGSFTYTLDDPYIHLALAKRIQSGFYGINPGEFAAPSSSILWPLLLAAIPSSAPGWVLLPALINFASVLVAAWTFLRALRLDNTTSILGALCLGAALAIAINAAGLVTTGMEHGLQLALTVLGVFGLIELERTGRFPTASAVALILGPLVRYENLGITLPACAYLVLVGRWKPAVLVLSICGIGLAAFSAVLLSHGLGVLPTSVMAKSHLVNSMLIMLDDHGVRDWSKAARQAAHMGAVGTLLGNVRANLMDVQAWILLGLCIPLALQLVAPADAANRRLAAFGLVAVALHLLEGRFNWYSRYEIYIVATVLIILIASHGERLRRALAHRTGARLSWARPVTLLALTAIVFSRYVEVLHTIPAACHDIYLQQIQMARFAGGYWRRPVGINDLGAVALATDQYVLDFLGLASEEPMRAWKTEPYDPAWMDKLARHHQVELAMIYMVLPDLPHNWTLVGKLQLDVLRITPAASTVGFYATTPGAIPQIRDQLESFAKTLPQGASLQIL
jgi:hypothetical protein